MPRPEPPTGITTEAFANSIKVQWRQGTSPDIKGYNVYNSQTSGGGVSGYIKLNDELIQIFTSVLREVVNSEEVVTESGNIRETTTTETLEQVFYYSHTHENLLEEKEQFYVITSVNNDGEESLYSTEIKDTPLVINTDLVDVPRKTKSDIILTYIDEIFRHDSNIDVKPGSITRDIHIDPHGSEFENAYILLNFHQISSSFLSLNKFDDEDEDRVSDPISESDKKIELRRALGYNDDGSEDYKVQEIIDNSFDKLASNSFTVRKGSIKSQGEITFYNTTAPNDDVLIESGEIVSTLPGQSTPAITFQTLATVNFIANNASSYFNTVTQRYEIKVPIEAIEEGTLSNVSANSIVNTTVGEFNVTNETSTFGGRDQESNADLADRALLAYRSLDVGTFYGYRKNAISVYNVEDVEIIDAGHALMQRDYDEVRGKHVFGKVDVYFQGEELEEFTETIGFLYNQVPNEEVVILQVESPSDNLILQTINPLVTLSKPIFQIDGIRNITQGKDYDVLGNVAIYINGVLQDKGRFKDVTVSLETGEVVFNQDLGIGLQVTAKYDALVEEEIVIQAAVGGETNAFLSNLGDEGVRDESYTIYKNGVELTLIADYTVNLITGEISFVTPLSTGDLITATYAYTINPEVLSALTVGGERTFTLNASPIYSSFSVDNGTDININRFNEINSTIATVLTDSILVTYRYRDSEPLILENQPVRSISSVVGTSSGTLIEDTHFVFNKQDDVILEGNSINAQRSIELVYNTSDGLPDGKVHNYVENVILVSDEPVELTYKGIIESSIIVQNLSRTVTYIKNIDYVINNENLSDEATISRVKTGSIVNGETVLVDYNYGEVLTIKYLVNNLVKKVQENINVNRHITADVLVKESPQTKVDITLSVKLKTLVDQASAKNNIITAIGDEINVKRMGESLFRSDIIRVVDDVDSVDYVVLPLTKMVKADDSIVVREIIDRNEITWTLLNGTTQTYITSLALTNENSISDGTFTITTLQSGIVNVDRIYNVTTGETYTYSSNTLNTITFTGLVPPLITDVLEVDYYIRRKALEYNTNGNANNTTQAFGVFENDEAVTLVNTENDVDLASSQGFIASDGAVLISPRNIPNPNGAVITVTYFIYGETGDNDIVINDIEHLDPGTITVLIV